jgi:excisionase family DNA binding protein
MVTTPEQLLYAVRDACAALNVSRATLYQMMPRGELAPIHIGRAVRFAVRDVRAFVERQQEAAQSGTQA